MECPTHGPASGTVVVTGNSECHETACEFVLRIFGEKHHACLAEEIVPLIFSDGIWHIELSSNRRILEDLPQLGDAPRLPMLVAAHPVPLLVEEHGNSAGDCVGLL